MREVLRVEGAWEKGCGERRSCRCVGNSISVILSVAKSAE